MRFLNVVVDRRGVALPLALVGLLIVSMLVTTALATSSTELAMSSAHQDATESLYDAEAALEGYLAERSNAQWVEPGATVYVTPDGTETNIWVDRVYRSGLYLSGADVSMNETYAVQARPTAGGRTVGAMASITAMLTNYKLDIDSGAASGGDLRVFGNQAIISHKSELCDSTAGDFAVQVSQGSTVSTSGGATIEGQVDSTTYTKQQLVDKILNGRTLEDYAKGAWYRVKRSSFSKRPNSSFSVSSADSIYNWGCPSGMVSCSAHTERRPVVDIDAEGGTVKLTGDHGQGMLIVRNGSLEISGNFQYKGVILVERDLKVLAAGGAGGAKIEGSVIALGENSSVEDDVGGNARISMNKCAIAEAQQSLNSRAILSAPKQFNGRSFSWFEVFL